MLRITISNERQRRQIKLEAGPLELGRGPKKEVERFIIEDRFVSRDQMRLEELPNNRIRLENMGGPTTMGDGDTLARGETQEVLLPVRLTVGYTMIEITGDAAEESRGGELQTISRPLQSLSTMNRQETINSLGKTPSPEKLAEWFETLLTVQRAAAGSGEFYQETAQAVVELVGLDHGAVILRNGDNWEVAAKYSTKEHKGHEFSTRVLSQVMEQQRTFYQGFDESTWQHSLVGVESVVASPIFDEDKDVTGVVYGSRSLTAKTARRGIQPLEAQVVQLLAGAVSVGLARVQREADLARTRVQFEQFCSPELARALERNPGLLESQERKVTVMFCDIRGYSGMAEKLGTRRSYDLLADVMDLLSDQIIAHAGIVVDFAGDGVFAMWNAPDEQADHPALACQAAQVIQRALPSLHENWSSDVDRPLEVGVGINTGEAQVGNAGSRKRMKYGPRGNTINLASRVEGTTRMFGVPTLITESTRAVLPPGFSTRRIRQVRVKHIDAPVTLFELCSGEADDCWKSLCQRYEEALGEFESGNFDAAARILQDLLRDKTCQDPKFSKVYEKLLTAWQAGELAVVVQTIHRLLKQPGFKGEAPSLLLAQHTAQCQHKGASNLAPVLTLDTK